MSPYRRLVKLKAKFWSLTPSEKEEYKSLLALNDKMIDEAASNLVKYDPQAIIRCLTCGSAEKEIGKLVSRVFVDAAALMSEIER